MKHTLSLCSLCSVLGWASHSQARFILCDAIRKWGWMLFIWVCEFLLQEPIPVSPEETFQEFLKRSTEMNIMKSLFQGFFSIWNLETPWNGIILLSSTRPVMYFEKKSFHGLKIFPNETEYSFPKRAVDYSPRMFLGRELVVFFIGEQNDLVMRCYVWVTRTAGSDLSKQVSPIKVI